MCALRGEGLLYRTYTFIRQRVIALFHWPAVYKLKQNLLPFEGEEEEKQKLGIG